jgi:tRNA (uracil-5-)-methyltransferase TRM9
MCSRYTRLSPRTSLLLDTRYALYSRSQSSHLHIVIVQPWPVVDDFLKNLEQGSIGADVGCGNGKYLGVNKQVCMLGSDMYANISVRCADSYAQISRSNNLISICRSRGFDVLVCDNLDLPYRSLAFVCSLPLCVFFSKPKYINLSLCRISS